MKRRVGVFGTGWVGASVAISTLHSGVADELVLYDMRSELAEGEAMDLAHAASSYPAAHVRAASVEETRAADVVVVAAGRGGRPGESRLGAAHVIEPDMSQQEREALEGSAEALRRAAAHAERHRVHWSE